MTLPRPERGDYDGVWICANPWIDLGAMLQSVVDGAKETGGEVLTSINPRNKTLGFYIEATEGDDWRCWEWEITTADLNRCLKDPKWQHLDALFRTHQGRVQIANTLSERKLP